jgi:hypothetical protein
MKPSPIGATQIPELLADEPRFPSWMRALGA